MPGPQKMCSASHKSRQIQQDDRHGQYGLGSDGLKSNEFKFRVLAVQSRNGHSGQKKSRLRQSFASKIRRPVLIRTSSKLRALDPKLKRDKASTRTG